MNETEKQRDRETDTPFWLNSVYKGFCSVTCGSFIVLCIERRKDGVRNDVVAVLEV